MWPKGILQVAGHGPWKRVLISVKGRGEAYSEARID